jgi:adenosylmethionine-8-amino-7-oxononanoate aminotransferase
MSDLITRDAAHVWHPYTRRATAPSPIPVARGEGAYLITQDGRWIFDAISSWWVTLHGHAQPQIAEAIGRQAAVLEQVIFAGCTHEPAVRLAERLAKVAPPGLTRTFYTDDGSTAVEAAIKMALQWWRIRGEQRSTIIALEHAYHGDTFGAMSVSGRGVFTESFGDLLFEVARVPDPDSGDTLAAIDEILSTRASECAALIIEPILMGAGGMRIYSPELLQAISDRVRASGVLIIADEVLTGFCRTGLMFAYLRTDITPDLMCLSKGITGGFMPLGATMATEEIYSAFDGSDPQRTLYHGHSFTANPLACAAGLASLSLLDEECAERIAAIRAANEKGLRKLEQDDRVRNTRQTGTVAAFDLVGPEGYLSDAAASLGPFAYERGILLRPLGNVVYLLPPFCSKPAEIQFVYDVIAEWLQQEC